MSVGKAMRQGRLPVAQVDLREGGEDDVRRLGIEGDIEFRRGRDVAVGGDCAAHHYAAGDTRWQGGIELQRKGEIGQRTQRNQQQAAGVLVRQAQDRQGRVLLLRLPGGGFVTGVAEAIVPVHIGRVPGAMQQRRSATGEHRHVDTGDLAQFQRIGDGVLEADVAGGDGEADDVMSRIVEGHQQGKGIIDAGVGVDQQGNALAHGDHYGG
jgi:hypothetical protein